MNIVEGARRMKVAGRWIVFIPLTVILVLMGVVLVVVCLSAAGALPVMELQFIAPLLILAVPGAFLWLAGWIVEGFDEHHH